MNVNRDVLDRLERLGLRYFVTGSEALSIYAEPRQTRDIDIVIDLPPVHYDVVIRPAFEDEYLVSDITHFGAKSLGSVIHKTMIAKADFIFRRQPDPWGGSAMARRRSVNDPILGPAWVISPEDLLLAKLEWSGGTSELQLRDCRNLIRQGPALDWPYIERYAVVLGVAQLVEQIRGG